VYQVETVYQVKTGIVYQVETNQVICLRLVVVYKNRVCTPTKPVYKMSQTTSASKLAWSIYNYLDSLTVHISHPTFGPLASKCRDMIFVNQKSFPPAIYDQLESTVFFVEISSLCGVHLNFTEYLNEAKVIVRKYIIKNGLVKLRMARGGDIGTLSTLGTDLLELIMDKL